MPFFIPPEDKMSELTEQQAAFVSHLVLDGLTPTESARRAGYAHAAQRATELVRKPHVMAAIRQEQSRLLDGDLANVALRTLRGVMEDQQSPASAKVAASRAVLEASGYFKREQESPLENKSPLDMSAQELEAFVRKGRAELRRMTETAGNA